MKQEKTMRGMPTTPGGRSTVGMAQKEKKALAKAQSMGMGGDTILAHINPQEAAVLKQMGGSGTVNPKTGLLQFLPGDGGGGGAYYNWTAPSSGSAANNPAYWGSQGVANSASYNQPATPAPAPTYVPSPALNTPAYVDIGYNANPYTGNIMSSALAPLAYQMQTPAQIYGQGSVIGGTPTNPTSPQFVQGYKPSFVRAVDQKYADATVANDPWAGLMSSIGNTDMSSYFDSVLSGGDMAGTRQGAYGGLYPSSATIERAVQAITEHANRGGSFGVDAQGNPITAYEAIQMARMGNLEGLRQAGFQDYASDLSAAYPNADHGMLATLKGLFGAGESSQVDTPQRLTNTALSKEQIVPVLNPDGTVGYENTWRGNLAEWALPAKFALSAGIGALTGGLGLLPSAAINLAAGKAYDSLSGNRNDFGGAAMAAKGLGGILSAMGDVKTGAATGLLGTGLGLAGQFRSSDRVGGISGLGQGGGGEQPIVADYRASASRTEPYVPTGIPSPADGSLGSIYAGEIGARPAYEWGGKSPAYSPADVAPESRIPDLGFAPQNNGMAPLAEVLGNAPALPDKLNVDPAVWWAANQRRLGRMSGASRFM